MNQNELLIRKIADYSLKSLSRYSSFELNVLRINGKPIISIVSISGNYLNGRIFYHSEMKEDEYSIEYITLKNDLNLLFKYDQSSHNYIICNDYFMQEIQPLIGYDYPNKTAEIEHASYNMAPLYYLKNTIKRNSSVASFVSDTKEVTRMPEKISEKIFDAFGCHANKLAQIGFEQFTPTLYIISTKQVITLDGSHIYEKEPGKNA